MQHPFHSLTTTLCQMKCTAPIFLTLAAVLQCAAGSAPPPPPPRRRIVGGVDAAPAVVRHTAYIVRRLQLGRKIALSACTGVVLSPRLVATAAHCVTVPNERRKWRVTSVAVWANLPLVDLSRAFFANATYASVVYKHRRYNSVTVMHDIAMLRLREPLRGGVRSVLLPRFKQELPNPTSVQTAGFGQTAIDGDSATVLQVTTLIKRRYQFCARLNNFKPTHAPFKMCATPPDLRRGGRGSCFGDSGGPLFKRAKGGRIRLFGIESYISGDCAAPSTINYFTRIVFYLVDIKRALKGKFNSNWVKTVLSKEALI